MKDYIEMMKDTDLVDKFKAAAIVIALTSLLIYGFYVHRDEPNWFEVRKVRVIK